MRVFKDLPLLVWLVAAFGGGIALAEVAPSLEVVLSLLATAAVAGALAYRVGRREVAAVAAVVAFAAAGTGHMLVQSGACRPGHRMLTGV